ncbi:unnamed protein product, partial [Gordionus sp. m RMFG-2023]
ISDRDVTSVCYHMTALGYSIATLGNMTSQIKNNITIKRIIDTNAGFILEENELNDGNTVENNILLNLKEKPNPLSIIDAQICIDCGKKFRDSYLYNTFDYSICDGCK